METKKTNKPGEAQLNVRIPAKLRREAKAQSALTGQPLEAVITELLEKWLREQKEAEHERASS
jgi:hypothetical protein